MPTLSLHLIQPEAIIDKNYVYFCFNAMKMISDSMSWVMNFKDDDSNVDDISRIYERNYIITFVSKLSEAGFSKLDLIGGEVAKSFDVGLNQNYAKLYAKIKRGMNPNYNRTPSIVFPDFLIHKSHGKESINRSNQHFIIEAKTNVIEKKEYFYLDFLKLNFYLENLNYDNAAYLIINNKKSDIQSYLNGYTDELTYYYKGICENLYFFIQEEYNSEPQIYVLTNQ